MNTMLLDRSAWDLCLDAQGNMAMASDPYSIAQDAASAIRLFKGELWYDKTKGVPYFEKVLGQFPSVSFMKAKFIGAALSVPQVASAQCFLKDLIERRLTGQVQIKTTAGVTVVTGF